MKLSLVQHVLGQMSVSTNVCSRQKFETGYRLMPRTVPDYNFIHVSRGHVVWEIDGKRHDLRPGDFVIVPPAVTHRGYSVTRKLTLTSLHVDARLPGGQDVFTLLNPPRQQHAAKNTRLAAYFAGATAEFDREVSEETHLMLRGWVHLLVRELFIQNAEEGLLVTTYTDPLVATLLEMLDGYMQRPVTLDELSKRSGFSAQHLNRVFREALGMTPLQYLTRTKLEKAASLLRDGRMTIHAIARDLGYDDAYYFSRIFRQQYKKSPAQYRESMNSDSPSRRSDSPFTK